MIFDAKWKDGLFTTACIICGLFIIVALAQEYAKRVYHQWVNNPCTPLDVDGFVDTATNPPKYLKIYFLQSMSVGRNRKPGEHTVKLASAESPHIPGLRVTERAEKRDGSSISPSKDLVPVSQDVCDDDTKPAPLVIGTIRMGFGHHRIAYAACSWAMSVDSDTGGTFLTSSQKTSSSSSSSSSHDRTTFFHDLLNVDSPEADLIKSADAAYSKLSRLTSNMGGLVEALWGRATLSGDGDSLRISGLTATHLRPLFKDLPRDTPIIATHCYVALAAVAAGFTNVVNLVIDNHAQWFVVVPGALNLVQGPVNYQNFLRMGVSEEDVRVAGHWIPRDVVVNIPVDCARRIARARTGFGEGEVGGVRPRRILIPVGGAGAQRKFIARFIRAMKGLVLEGRVQLFLNAGDHVHMKACFTDVLKEIGLEGKYKNVNSSEGVTAFRDNLLAGNEPETTVTLFSFDTYFPAVATTDILSRVADVLACKPSELAFYPVPKLMIRRVGDHEQYSALRAAELGDGTLEAREIEDAMAYVGLMVDKPDLLVQMNDSIIKNAEIGVYDGCKNAVRIALEREREMKKIA